MQSRSHLVGPTYLLVTIATLMLQFALYDRQGLTPQEWIHLAFALAVATAIKHKDRFGTEKAARLTSVCGFSALAVSPIVWNLFGRSMGHFGHPFEILVVLCLRNLMISLTVGVDDKRSKMFASLASCFLALFSLLWSMNSWTIALLIAYTITGMWWLLGAYWDRLSDCFLTHTERAIPWKPAIGATTLAALLTLVAFPLVTGQDYTTAIQGFLPSSGGTGSQDEFAFGGVGDGPQMVAAKESASSFGPIESELFLESKMPSLYDAINEFSDPPPKPVKKKRPKAIPLSTTQVQENHQRRGTTQQSGREFSTVRVRKRTPRKVKDKRSHALLQVAGRVPVHLGLYTYDIWDGHKLTSSNSVEAISMYLDIDMSDRKNWVRFQGMPTDELLTYPDRHEIRIINLKSDRVPSPPCTRAVRLDKIHSPRFFDTTQDGMLAIDVEFIPQLTVLHVESLRRSTTQVPELAQRSPVKEASEDTFGILAREWTVGISDGWPQIEAICARLQQEYALDPNALVSQNVEDAAEHFLSSTKRGPDYLFATSAALLMRSLGYETRVVSGFYADPENYSRQSRLTSVYADDAHFWVEVLASPRKSESTGEKQGRDRWLAVDPSPGYQVLLAPETLWSQLLYRAALTWQVVRSNPISTITLFVCISAIWYKKAEVGDQLVTGWWQLHHRWGDVRHQVLSTLRLLDRRARVRGCPRPKALSLSKWNLSLSQKQSETMNWEAAFLSLANWALYAEGHSASYSRDEVNDLCKSAAALGLRPAKKQRVSAFSHTIEEAQ